LFKAIGNSKETGRVTGQQANYAVKLNFLSTSKGGWTGIFARPKYPWQDQRGHIYAIEIYQKCVTKYLK